MFLDALIRMPEAAHVSRAKTHEKRASNHRPETGFSAALEQARQHAKNQTPKNSVPMLPPLICLNSSGATTNA